MSNTDHANALLTAINFDRFAEIEARHKPDATFWSFRGPTLHDSVSIADWHRDFLRDYADCSYEAPEAIEQGSTVAVRADIHAKGYDWREFVQRVVEVFTLGEGTVAERRLYAMLRDVELGKPEMAAMNAAAGAQDGTAATTKSAVDAFYAAVLKDDREAAVAALAEKAVLIDSVYGMAAGPQAIVDLLGSVPRPPFGQLRVTRTLAGPKDALVELAYDPQRPRAAHWLRLAGGKIVVVEVYWMLREAGINPREEYARERHQRKAILPI